jgi:hypothetical protein
MEIGGWFCDMDGTAGDWAEAGDTARRAEIAKMKKRGFTKKGIV